jgi:hypothetical protein
MIKSCVCSLFQIGFTLRTNALKPFPMGFHMVSSKKWGTMRFNRPWVKGFNVNHP